MRGNPPCASSSGWPEDFRSVARAQRSVLIWWMMWFNTADLTTPSSTRTTNSENCNAGADKTHKKKGQKRKSSADINKDTKGHGSLQPDRGRQERVSHICCKALDADNSSLRLFSQHNSLSRREKSNITAALKAPPKYKREQTADGEWVLNKVTAYKQGQCNVYQSDFSRLNDDT